jgi:hypothetical protein
MHPFSSFDCIAFHASPNNMLVPDFMYCKAQGQAAHSVCLPMHLLRVRFEILRDWVMAIR